MKPPKTLDKRLNHGLLILFIKDKNLVRSANSSFDPHYFILLLIKKGKAQLQVNGNHFRIHPGKLLLISKEEPWSMDKPSPKIHIGVLGFTMKYVLENGIRPLPYSLIRLWSSNFQSIDLMQKEVSWLFLLLQLLGTKVSFPTTSLAHGYVLRHGLYMLLWELSDLFRKDGKVPSITHTAGHMLVLQFMGLLAIHFKREHRVGFYANCLNVTPDHLSKTVKKHTGITVKAHIKTILMEEAKALLRDTVSIKEIAQILGFKTLYGFSKFFKRNASLSPKSYRIKIKTIQ
ncbi:AraC family transcriptional regulator [Allomuricauda sp. F6463D]|uniref:AraC family transcriptional regulator n=1 Tax=Allomuricauda sp. F6463D TaxID=2926409 RepID=UPI001FF41AF5|nr:helix-turn-helix transcriptional regulator [Muricauda sp. F6463D]MCK0160513.1 helix-turn-helix transcriptional regulator [Muricauda sp. F6463D]